MTQESEIFIVNLKNNNFYNFSYFVLKKEFRHLGIGTKIIKFCQKKYKKLWLGASPHNFKFYEKRAFKKRIQIEDSIRFIFTYE